MLVHEESEQYGSAELKQLTYDEALTQVGGAGLYQKRAFLIFGLQWMITNWILFSPVFFFIEPTVDCKNNTECLSQCTSESLDEKCLTYDDSQRREFVVGESLNTAFNALLPCNKSLQSIIKSIVYIGSLSGFFVFSFIADNYGRKLALSIAWGMTTLGSLLLAFAMNYSMIAIGIFLLGFGGNPAITVHYSFINEHSQGHFREIQNVGVQVFFAIGEFTIITLAYFIKKWRWLAISVALPTVLLNLCNFLIFESPQFLYSKNKKKCVKVLNQIAKINNTQSLAINELASNPQSKENNSRVYTIWDLLKYKSLRYVFFAGVMMFFAIQVTYYGISFVSDQLGLDFFLSNFIIAFFELLAYATTDFFITKLNRKKNIIGGFFIVGFMSLYFILKSDHIVFRIFQGIFAGLMRFLICVVWALAYVYVSELFPSVVRSLALCLIQKKLDNLLKQLYQQVVQLVVLLKHFQQMFVLPQIFILWLHLVQLDFYALCFYSLLERLYINHYWKRFKRMRIESERACYISMNQKKLQHLFLFLIVMKNDYFLILIFLVLNNGQLQYYQYFLFFISPRILFVLNY